MIEAFVTAFAMGLGAVLGLVIPSFIIFVILLHMSE